MDFNDSKDGAQVTLRGGMFQSVGPVTAKDLSKMEFVYLSRAGHSSEFRD